MKKTIIATMVMLFSIAQADCPNMPLTEELSKSIESKEISKAKELLTQYKEDVKNYLAKCDQSKEKFEETSVMIHTYEDSIADVEYDVKNANTSTDCSKVPSTAKLEDSFKSKVGADIKAHYASYQQDAKNYIEHCASHAEYETVYESSMMCDEEYAEWKANNN